MNYNDIIGTIGVSIVLAAYFLNIFSLIPKEGALFFILNILGACITCYTSIIIDYKPFAMLEGIWVLVSLFGLIKSLKK
ncbi:hypothetical protein SL053_001557 [Flavobacterium psychrophilum]|uniref:CBU-0592-like domain-containing protein n=2 Tax=Flavobacterium psychrophilum TaxID=96345 RepID=A0A075RDX5_FLAPS|nr:hypothetical protein [Flavobacterium psychrophilum]AIG29403.1 hypothetical protein IA03_02470 [Flavobacterium psychrophilum]AIG31680.1 hypothetical protein IA01_02490 [Flavobacterium psychrophilum]AIG33834.1 hypothetical protein IA02_01875 [Flavobacterium psychrophilum]AIG36196.1 hypothetical protein IA04_02380 [Flavobacterium psychrophilum]AIG38462.1 hypothetical protein IA05_02465 [Flavobacterium psychrophilum]